MKLPDIDKAEIKESKITQYLLSTTHRAGKSKAAFFTRFGFDADHWEELAMALRQHAHDNDITLEVKTAFGTRYVIDGPLKGHRTNDG